MKVLALYNIKGGVGKTAAAVNLGYISAKAGLRTLIWDLDPQGAASFYYRIRAKVRGGGKKLIRGKRPLPAAEPLRKYRNLPASLAASLAIFQLGESGGGRRSMWKRSVTRV